MIKNILKPNQALKIMLFHLSVLCSCALNKSVNSDYVPLDLTNPEKYQIDQFPLIESIYIPLETSKKCLIGDVSQILINNDKIYVLDRRYAKALFVFDISGKFLYRVGESGKGPGEYVFLGDFDLDGNDNVFINDQGSKKILKFDSNGKYIKDISYGFFISKMKVLDEDLFLLYRGTSAEYQEENSLSDYTCVFWSATKNKFEKKYFHYQGMNVEPLRALGFYHSNNEINFIRNCDDVVYGITSEGIKSKYRILFGNDNKRIMEELNSMEFEEALEYSRLGKMGPYVEGIYENDNNVMFSFIKEDNKRSKRWICVYSKKSGTIKTAYSFNMLKDKKQNFLGELKPSGVYNQYYYSVIGDQPLESYIKQAKNNEFFKEAMGHLSVMDTLPYMKEGSNPIIALYKLQDF